MTKTTELAYWVNERHRMHVCKDAAEKMNAEFPGQEYPAGPGLKYGWSDDPAMGLVRYCNVHREDDKVTRWMRTNWSTAQSPIWWFVLGRMLNYIPTLESLVDYGVDSVSGERDEASLPSIDGIGDGLKMTRATGAKIFTSVYTISTCGESMDKIDYVMRVVAAVKDAEDNPLVYWPDLSSLENCWKSLCMVKGLGSFLSAQVIADLKNTKGHPLAQAPDFWSWCAPGPGSIKGLQEYFYPDEEWNRVTPGNFQAHIEACWKEVQPLINPSIPPIHMQDFQNCLCEFSKYERVKKGGHVRNRYTT